MMWERNNLRTDFNLELSKSRTTTNSKLSVIFKAKCLSKLTRAPSRKFLVLS